MSLVYLTTCYPTPVETFVRQEVQGLRAMGLPLYAVLSLKKGAQIQAQDGVVLGQGIVWNELLCGMVLGLRHPRRLLSMIILAIGLDWRSLMDLRAGHSSLLKTLGLLPLLLALDRKLPTDLKHIHAHFAGIATTAACLLAHWRGIGFSFTAHGSDVHVYAPLDLKARLQRCTFCVTVSHFNKRHLLQTCGSQWEEKIHVVRCGISIKDFEVLRAGRSWNGEPSLLTVARLDPVKGLESFMQAVALHRDKGGAPFQWNVVGEGPDRKRLESAIQELRLERWVTLHGLATPNEVREHLQRAHAFVLPSLSEGFPVVLMEAAAARLPLLASRITGIPEILREMKNGLFLEPGQPQQQQLVLARLSDQDWFLLRTLEKGAQQLDLSEFDSSHTLTQLADLLWPTCR